MAENSPPNPGFQENTSSSVTVVETVTGNEQDQERPTVRLRLRKPKQDKKVQWSTETVDNEHMNKKKSNCCCIYHKPKSFDEDSSSSSSSEDDECEHCKGHVDKKKKRKSSPLPADANGVVLLPETSQTEQRNENNSNPSPPIHEENEINPTTSS